MMLALAIELPVGTEAIDDARIRGRGYLGNAAINADGGVAGLASGLSGFKFPVSEAACDLRSQAG